MKKNRFLQPTPKRYRSISKKMGLIVGLCGVVATAPVSGTILTVSGIIAGVASAVALYCEGQVEKE